MSTIKTIAHVALFSVLSFSVTNVAHAGLVQLDQFQVIKNGFTFFEDNFNDGIAPPSSNGVTPSGTCFPGGSAAPCSNTYFVSTGSGFGPEAGGKLTINSANGIIPSEANVLQRAILRSNTLPQGTGTGQSNLGLKADDAIIVNRLFDLVVSGLNDNESFGIRLTDRFDINGVNTFKTRDNEFINDSARLVVLYPAGGGARVGLKKLNSPHC